MARHRLWPLALFTCALALSLSCASEVDAPGPKVPADAAHELSPAAGLDAGCLIGGARFAVGEANPESACQACWPESGATTWTNEARGTGCAKAACQAGTCDGEGTCVSQPLKAGTPCGSVNPCAPGRCDGLGACVHLRLTAGASCDSDPSDCADQRCDGLGHCLAEARPARSGCADDGNPCTRDECDDGGACLHQPMPGASCEDDGNPCTGANVCDALGGCLHVPVLGAPCEEDGNLCTRDLCGAEGVCEHLPRAEGSSCGISTCQADACRVGLEEGGRRCQDGILQARGEGGWWFSVGQCADDFYGDSNVLHWNGESWGPGTEGLPGLRTVDLSGSGGAVWLLGAPLTAEEGIRAHLWRWNGSAWTEIARLQGLQAQGLWDTGLGRVYVYGADQFQNLALFSWQGGTFTDELPGAPGPGLVAQVRSAPDGTTWAVGHGPRGGLALHGSTQGWTQTFVPNSGRRLVSVFVTSAREAWTADESGEVFRWNGTAWSAWRRDELGGCAFRSVFGFGAQDVWLAGTCEGVEQQVTVRWDGKGLRAFVGGGTSFYRRGRDSLFSIRPSFNCSGGAAGRTVAFDFDGSAWSSDTSALGLAVARAGKALGTVWGTGADDAWFIAQPDAYDCFDW